ncbi:MAG TPA: H-X9-DG-CTERM domain-containing protein, partial [Pirellulales bacterium]
GSGNTTPPYAGGTVYGKINSPTDTMGSSMYYPYTNARPSSNHPSGVNMMFCDGHSRFVSQDIDYAVYCLLMSSYGQQVMPPGQMSAPGTTVWNYLRNSVVDESAIP